MMWLIRPTNFVLLCVFLVSVFLIRSYYIMTTLTSLQLQQVSVFDSKKDSWDNTVRNNNNNNNNECNNGNEKYRNPYTAATTGEDALRLFRTDLQLIRLIGNGDVSYGFEARYENRTVIAKIASDNDLYYSDVEIDIFRELKAPPSIPNIPELHLAIRSMPNPFASINNNNTDNSNTYLVQDLKLTKSDAKSLVMQQRVSVMVMDLFKNKREPEDLSELRRFMKSLLETMRFVHSRNIMHCDLHELNYFWDGEKAYLFDWNGAFKYAKDKVKIHYPRAPHHLFPPEAWDNVTAVHASVSAFDVYTIGMLLKRYLKSCCGMTLKKFKKNRSLLDANDLETILRNSSSDNDQPHANAPLLLLLDETMVAYDLALYMMTTDPYKRPDTNAALQHYFFVQNKTAL